MNYGDRTGHDFKGDGKAALAREIHRRCLGVFVGNGAGKFSSWSKGLDLVVPRSGYDGSGFSSRRIEVLDWNQDGKPDLLALSEGPRISISSVAKTTTLTGANVRPAVFGPKVFLNNGNGTWTALAESGARREIFGDDLAVADFDGNGSPDFLISSNAMPVQLGPASQYEERVPSMQRSGWRS